NDTVAISSSDLNAALPSNAALVGGTKSFTITLNNVGSATLTATDLTDPARGASTSPAILVNTGAATKLLVLLPGETAAPATATGKTGTPLDQVAGAAIVGGIVVSAVDSNWNQVSSSTANVTLTTSDSNATIADDNGGTTGNLTLVSGARTSSSLTFNPAGTRTITASASGLAAATSASVNVNAGPFAKLQLLLPGETAAPGSPTGKTGS